MNQHAILNMANQNIDKTTNDDYWTPSYGVRPLLEYLEPFRGKIIWAPFDTAESEYVKVLEANGFNVIWSHISEGKDFFKYQPTEFDLIVSNPPFSKKDAILKRCYQLGKPFALLLPLSTLQSVYRGKMFIDYGIQLLAFDNRIHFIDKKHGGEYKRANYQSTIYFCRGLLPSKLEYKQINHDNTDQIKIKI